jgi:hypothetical protein
MIFGKPVFQRLNDTLRVALVLAADDGVIRVPVEFDMTGTVRLHLSIKPGVDDIVCEHIRQDRAVYASNNRAKLPLELSICIDRALLKGGYGEGFGGAPLCTSPATHRLAIGVRGRHDEHYEQSSTNVGGNDHV